jgi:hypothetical protein
MGTSLSLPTAGNVPTVEAVGPGIRKCVDHQEWLERVVPRIAFWTILGTALLMLLQRYHWHVTGGVLMGGLVALILARLAVAAAGFVLSVVRRLRFGSAARKLRTVLIKAADLTSPPCIWYTGAPGAFGLTAAGELLLVDRSTGYELLWLRPDQIAEVAVEREVTQVTSTRHTGRSVIGGAGGGVFGGWVSGGRSTSVSRNIEEAFLEIHYQLEVNGIVRVAVAPFGSDRRGAQAACAMIQRLAAY